VQVYTTEGVGTEHMGVFYNSFYLSNFEWTMKSYIGTGPDKKPEDPRLEKKNKHISFWNVISEKGAFEGLEPFKF
jgi:hypothetical protein